MGSDKQGKEGLRCPIFQSHGKKGTFLPAPREGEDRVLVKDKPCTMFISQSAAIR